MDLTKNKHYFDKIQQPYWIYFTTLTIPLFLLLVYLLWSTKVIPLTLYSYLIFYVVIYIYGTNIFFHRYWSHKQFICNNTILKFFTIAGLFSLSGGPIHYVLVHRFHHHHSDDDLDPHSPCHGRYHAFIGWIFKAHTLKIPLKIIRDLLADKNSWLLKIDAYKRQIIYTIVLITLVIDKNITVGLLLAMFTTLLIELSINAFLHDPKTKTALNSNILFCWLTAGGLMHKIHHDKSSVLTKEDPGYYFVKLICR